MNFLNPSQRAVPFQRSRVIGYRIRLSDGTLISEKYVARHWPEFCAASDLPARFATRNQAATLVKVAKNAVEHSRVVSVFKIHRYRYEPIYG